MIANINIHRLFFSLIAFGLVPMSLISQGVLRLDLANHSPGEVVSVQGNKKFDFILLENTVAHFVYSIEVKKSKVPLPILQSNNSGFTESNSTTLPTECNELNQKIKDLENFQKKNPNNGEFSEKKLKELVEKLNKEIDKKSCTDVAIINFAQQWLNTTSKKYNEEIVVGHGEKIVIVVKRDSLTWTFIYEGEPQGQWVSSYGFGFTPKAFGSRPYFAKQLPDTSTFEITQSKKSKVLDLNYIPAIFFSYFPSQNFDKYWNRSFTGGLGFDLSAPVVFLGYNQMYKQNIGFSAGLVFQQQYVLKDQYLEGQPIVNFLDKDQLHDKVYRPNFFISANFRLGKNPFQEDEPKDSQEKK